MGSGFVSWHFFHRFFPCTKHRRSRVQGSGQLSHTATRGNGLAVLICRWCPINTRISGASTQLVRPRLKHQPGSGRVSDKAVFPSFSTALITPQHCLSSRHCLDPTTTPGVTTVEFSWPSPKAPRPTSSSECQGTGTAPAARAGDGRECPAAGRTCPWHLSQSPSCRYSTNEGETWKVFTFSEKPVFVYGLLTEPGEKSTIFTIFGSYKENGHSWLILQINTTDVLGKGTGGRAISGLALQVGERASPHALSFMPHVHVDTAAEGTHVPCALPVFLPSSLRNLLKRKGGKKKIPSEGLCL